MGWSLVTRSLSLSNPCLTNEYLDTSEVNCYRFTHQNTEFVLVDTPGFDDTNCSDEAVMTCVLKWLESSFRSGTRLNGLIYLHRIIDPKMQGSALNNMRMFRKLCGPDCFGNIILATTFWDDVPEDLGTQREEELKSNDEFWGKMVKKGSEVVRLGQDKESGMKLLIEIAKKSKITLHSQHEMVDENKSAQETAAAQSIHAEILKQREEFERRIEQQRVEHERELERRRIERQLELERERIYAAEQEEQRAILAALQKREEEDAWKAEYKRKQQELRKAEEEAERERKRLAAIEQRKQEAARAHRQEQEKLKAERQAHYRSYTCQEISMTYLYCDKCRKIITNEYYYRKFSLPGFQSSPMESYNPRHPFPYVRALKYRLRMRSAQIAAFAPAIITTPVLRVGLVVRSPSIL